MLARHSRAHVYPHLLKQNCECSLGQHWQHPKFRPVHEDVSGIVEQYTVALRNGHKGRGRERDRGRVEAHAFRRLQHSVSILVQSARTTYCKEGARVQNKHESAATSSSTELGKLFNSTRDRRQQGILTNAVVQHVTI